MESNVTFRKSVVLSLMFSATVLTSGIAEGQCVRKDLKYKDIIAPPSLARSVLVHHAYFMPIPDCEVGQPDLLEGELTLEAAPMMVLSSVPSEFPGLEFMEDSLDLTVGDYEWRYLCDDDDVLDPELFPRVTIGFVVECLQDGQTETCHLVPHTRDIVPSQSSSAGDSWWDIIVEPGRAWREVLDGPWSRASFPFALVNPVENETHNGVATFMYDVDDQDGSVEVTPVVYQITHQTANWFVGPEFRAYWSLATEFAPADVDAGDFAAEKDAALETRPWDELKDGLADDLADYVDDFDRADHPENRVTSAFSQVENGEEVVYLKPPGSEPSVLGEFPYASNMRVGVWSVTKSIAATLAMLYLEKEHPGVFDAELVEYVPELLESEEDVWAGVTFGDALNMTTGVGYCLGDDPTICNCCPSEPGPGQVCEEGPRNDAGPSNPDWIVDVSTFYCSPSAGEKLEQVLRAPGLLREPGDCFRYRDEDHFVLGLALDKYFKDESGSSADLWDSLAEEVLKEIGVYHAPITRTIEPGSDGTPVTSYGYLPTIDDLVKIARLLHDRGSHDDVQLLDPVSTARLFSVADTPEFDAHRTEHSEAIVEFYYMGFWHQPVECVGVQDPMVSFMGGFGGNTVMLFPDGTTAIRIMSHDELDNTVVWGEASDVSIDLVDVLNIARINGICDDSDGDGIPDAIDVCPDDVNPDQIDTDGDGHGDPCDEDDDDDGTPDSEDPCPLDDEDDADGDGVCGDEDNCPYVSPSPPLEPSDQSDTDMDGVGDICDNCLLTQNPGQEDTDGDGFGDACDDCPMLNDPDEVDCDDGVYCTIDSCGAAGCEHEASNSRCAGVCQVCSSVGCIPIDELCPSGYICTASGQCVEEFGGG